MSSSSAVSAMSPSGKESFSTPVASKMCIRDRVYSGQLPQKETFSLKGKTLSQVLGWLFDENTGEDDFHGLENARDIVERYSGNLSLSGAPGEVILRMSLRF